MKTVWYINCVALIAFVSFGLISLPSQAAEELKIEGLIEIDYPEAGEPKVEVNLAGTLFALAAKAMKEEDPETSEFLANLKALKVRIYDEAALGGKTYDDVLKFYKQQLKKPKWEVLASVKEEGSSVGVYSFMKEDVISGLVVLIGNAEEFVIVNLAGKIDISKLSKLTELPQIGEITNLIPKGGGKEPGFVVRGTVKDAETGDPIPGAEVSDDGYGPKPYKGATTDSDGKYSYKTWYEEHNIIAKAPGYKPQRKVLLTKLLMVEKEKVIDFELIPEKSR